jgi:hypothetical protein
MLSNGLKYASSMLEMTEPEQVAAFGIFRCDVESAAALRQSLPLPDLLCDLTPKASFDDVFPERPMPVSTLTVVPCPICGAKHEAIPCGLCSGRRKLIVAHPAYM